MELNNGRSFWMHVRDNNEFRHRLSGASTDQELAKVILEAGFTLTAADLQASLNEWNKPGNSRELSDADLETVAGGGFGGAMGFSLSDVHNGINFVMTTGYKG